MNASRKTALLGMLTAAAVALSFLESLLPVLPFLPPGAKAGFSNVVTMFAAGFWGPLPALTVAVLKSGFVLVTRGAAAGAMSLCGGALSTLVMWLCLKGRCSLLITGVAGALTHNLAQLGVAIAMTQTPGLVYYLSALMLFAVAAGTVTGLLLKAVWPPLTILADRLLGPKEKR